ncbi:hypothetical protein [Arthrobacter cheniae]|nr:hypothetical protein [Arthrobacter cheniae]
MVGHANSSIPAEWPLPPARATLRILTVVASACVLDNDVVPAVGLGMPHS